MSARVGIDIGGTNIRIAVYDQAPTAASQPLVRRRELVGNQRSPAAVVDRLGGLVESCLAEAGADPGAPVGIGIAAMMRGTDGTVARSPHLNWVDVPFGALMRERLGGERRVVIDNDVNVITYGEWKVGAGVGVDDLLAVFVGTGIGAGIVADGHLVTGASGAAAELGHSKVRWGSNAALCACGLRGCVEAYCGGTYLQRRARRELSAGVRSSAVVDAGGADRVTPGHLDRAAETGDGYALDLYAEVSPLLGVVLANAVSLLNPARLILGGGMLSRTPVLREYVLAAYELAVNPPAGATCEIVDAALGDDAGLVGGALLAS